MEDQKPDKAALDRSILDANNTHQGVDGQVPIESVTVKEEPQETDQGYWNQNGKPKILNYIFIPGGP